jgi:hypothetical protein
VIASYLQYAPPDSPGAWMNLGMALLQADDLSHAYAAFLISVELAYKDRQVHPVSFLWIETPWLLKRAEILHARAVVRIQSLHREKAWEVYREEAQQPWPEEPSSADEEDAGTGLGQEPMRRP